MRQLTTNENCLGRNVVGVLLFSAAWGASYPDQLAVELQASFSAQAVTGARFRSVCQTWLVITLLIPQTARLPIATAAFATQAHFFQILPVTRRVVHGDLSPSLDPFRYDDDPLHT